MQSAPYRLDELGWLQSERLCDLVLAQEAGVGEVMWRGRAGRGRVALLDDGVVLERVGIRLPGPLAVAVLWVRPSPSEEDRLTRLLAGAWAVPSELGFWFERVLVLTNLDAREAHIALPRRSGEERTFAVLGASELGDSLDRHPALRAAMPSVLGLRDLDELIAPDVRRRSRLAIDSAQALARVFSPTQAYERARTVLSRHRFVVLTGPPEMGKTAIARMVALAQLTEGWEAHECTSPEQVWEAFDGERRQVFVADDAFGSTEYRADAAELWARELGRMLHALDDRHWLIWTSRPAPLKAGLRRVQRERGSERFPAPGEVLVDASELNLTEKTLILFRHAKAHRADETARGLLRSAGVSIVEHPHFTPERIRRLVADRLDELLCAGGRSLLAVVEDELASPTDAMQTSFRALEDEHRELLIALLDAPAGLIDERELTATVRRHRTGGLLSRKGGASGERSFPLLISDGDWDTLGGPCFCSTRGTRPTRCSSSPPSRRPSASPGANWCPRARCSSEVSARETSSISTTGSRWPRSSPPMSRPCSSASSSTNPTGNCSSRTWRSSSARLPIPTWRAWRRTCCAGSGSCHRGTTAWPGPRCASFSRSPPTSAGGCHGTSTRPPAPSA